MARLLRNDDYISYIQEENMLQIIESNWTLVEDVEQAGQREMYGYLNQRYITDEIFTNTSAFSMTATYYGKNLVYLTATAYSASSTYALNVLTKQAGNIYYCSTAIPVAEAFNAAHWTLLGADGAMFYVKLPNNEYNPDSTYVSGNIVWYADKTYTAKSTVKGVLPTEAQFWTEGSTYTVSEVGTGNTSKWTAGDNRNPLIVMRLIDITLFHIHSRISPRNVPDLRRQRYDGDSPAQIGGAIGWLKQIAEGKVNVDLPERLPEQNLAINWGNSGGGTTFYPNTY